MKKLSFAILAVAGALVSAVPTLAADTVAYSLTTVAPTVAAGSAVIFNASIVAPASNSGSISIISDSFTCDGCTIDDTNFTSTPFALVPGQNYTGPLFSVTALSADLAGLYTGFFDITFADAQGNTFTDSVPFTIVSPVMLPPAIYGTPYTSPAISVTGGTLLYPIGITSADGVTPPPSFLSISNNQIIGTPPTVNPAGYIFTITATDNTGNQIPRLYAVIANPAPLTVTADNQTRAVGDANPAFTGSASGAVLGDTFTVSGTTTATAASPAGTYTITPAVTGTNIGKYTVTYVPGTLTITPPVKPTPTVTLTVSPDPLLAGLTAIITATLSPSDATGTVTFTENGTAISGCSNVVVTGGSAKCVTAPVAGSASLSGSYSGDAKYSAVAAISPLTINVGPAGTGKDFPISLSSTSVNISADGGSASVNVTVTAPAGSAFTGAVQLSASGLPAGTTANFSPASITPAGGSATSMLTITMPKASASLRSYSPIAFALLFLPLVWTRRAKILSAGCLLAIAIAFGAVAGLAGCGGGSIGNTARTPQSYTITVTGTSGNLKGSTTFTLSQ